MATGLRPHGTDIGDMFTEASFDPPKANGQQVLRSLPVRSLACPYVIPLPRMMRCKVPDPYKNPYYTKCSRAYENELLKRQSTVGDVLFFAEDLTEHVMCRSQLAREPGGWGDGATAR